MLPDIKQAELDAAEELLFNRVLGGTQLSPTADFILKTLNIDVNNYIQKFESLIKPFMSDTGMIQGALLRQAIAVKSPKASELIPPHDFRLKDVVEGVLSCL